MGGDATSQEREEKKRRILDILDELDLEALILREPGNVAWWSGGGRTHVLATPDIGVADLVIYRDKTRLVTTISELARMREEELFGVADESVVLPWDAERADFLPRGQSVGSDVPLSGRRHIGCAVLRARQSLTHGEVKRYRDLGRDLAVSMGEVMRVARASETEVEIAGRVAHALISMGIDPVVLLAAGEQRMHKYRHPLPTSTKLGSQAMLTVCGRRGGLIVNATRVISFSSSSEEIDDRHRRLLDVEMTYLDATRIGALVGEIFDAGCKSYAQAGFDPQEWTRHHQGGPTGYATRDYRATNRSKESVVAWQAFAWNPTAAGVKTEDTVLVTSDSLEVITVDDKWPTVEVGGRARPRVYRL